MDGFVISVAPEDVAALFGSAESAAAVIERTQALPDARLELDDAWIALHFLLSGELPMPKDEALRRGQRWDADSFESVLMGGEPTSFEGFYGAARYLPPAEVALLARKLGALTPADFAARYDPAAFARNRILPAIWDDEPHARRWLGEHFFRLVRFYETAAAAERGLMIYML